MATHLGEVSVSGPTYVPDTNTRRAADGASAPITLEATAGESLSVSAAGGGPCTFTAPSTFSAAVVSSCNGRSMHVRPRAAPVSPPALLRLASTIEDRALTIALTAATTYSGRFVPVITAPPRRGALYNIASEDDPTDGALISTSGTAVDGTGGYVRYVPSLHGAGTAYDHFEVSFRLVGASPPVESAPVSYTINVAEVDDLPVVASHTFHAVEDASPGGLVLHLNMSDAEAGQMLDAFITRLPTKGRLYNLDAAGDATLITSTYNPFDVRPRIRAHAFVPRRPVPRRPGPRRPGPRRPVPRRHAPRHVP